MGFWKRNPLRLPVKTGLLVVAVVVCFTVTPVAFANDMVGVPIETLKEEPISTFKTQGYSPLDISLIPSSYKSPYITSVKNQNNTNACWAFAAASIMEANAKVPSKMVASLGSSSWVGRA